MDHSAPKAQAVPVQRQPLLMEFVMHGENQDLLSSEKILKALVEKRK
jgi:hypothetical protein